MSLVSKHKLVNTEAFVIPDNAPFPMVQSKCQATVTDRQADKHTDGYRDRETQRQAGRHTDRQKDDGTQAGKQADGVTDKPSVGRHTDKTGRLQTDWKIRLH